MIQDKAKEALIKLKSPQPKSYDFKDFKDIVEGKKAKKVEPVKSQEELLREANALQQKIERIMHQMDNAVYGGSSTSSGYLNYYWTIKDLEKKFLEEIKALDSVDKEYLKPQFMTRVNYRKEKILQRQKEEDKRMQSSRR